MKYQAEKEAGHARSNTCTPFSNDRHIATRNEKRNFNDGAGGAQQFEGFIGHNLCCLSPDRQRRCCCILISSESVRLDELFKAAAGSFRSNPLHRRFDWLAGTSLKHGLGEQEFRVRLWQERMIL